MTATLTARAALRTARAAGVPMEFYQSTFEPAVLAACGHGFGRRAAVDPAQPSKLDDFLANRTNRFDCGDLPVPLVLGADVWKGTWFYLFLATAATWRLTGIEWTALDALTGALAGGAVLALYGLFRLASGRLWSAAGALLMLVSPLHLAELPQMRDYSKAPFVLGSVLALGALIARPRPASATVALAAAFGAIVGVGYGFRADLVVLLPLGIVVTLVLLPGGLVRHAGRNATAAAALVAAFGAAAFPVLRALQTGGGCTFHVALLGLTTPFTSALGLEPAAYNFGSQYSDTLVDLKVGDYAHRVRGTRAPGLCSPEYDAASGALTRDIVAMFPADILVRGYASATSIAAQSLAFREAPPFLSAGAVGAAYAWVERVTRPLARLGVLVVAAAIIGAWSVDARIGAALLLVFGYLAAYPGIQFHPRHWFHLQFMSWWALGLAVPGALALARRRVPRASLGRAVAGAFCVAVVPWALLGAARAYQRPNVRRWIGEYERATTEPLDFRRVPSSAGVSAFEVQWQPAEQVDGRAGRASDLLVLTFDGDGCPAAIPLTVRYSADVPTHDLSETIAVGRAAAAGAAGRTTVYVPIFGLRDGPVSLLRFDRIELPDRAAACVAAVARVADGAGPRVWMQLQLTPAEPPLYQTMMHRPAFGRAPVRVF